MIKNDYSNILKRRKGMKKFISYKTILIPVLIVSSFKIYSYMQANQDMLSFSVDTELAKVLDPKQIEASVLDRIRILKNKKTADNIMKQALYEALNAAVYLGLNDLAVKLLKEGADANGSMNKPWASPLSMAIDKHNLFMVVTLINAGAIVHTREIQLAEYWGYSDIALVLKQYLNPEEQAYAGARVETFRGHSLS